MLATALLADLRAIAHHAAPQGAVALWHALILAALDRLLATFHAFFAAWQAGRLTPPQPQPARRARAAAPTRRIHRHSTPLRQRRTARPISAARVTTPAHRTLRRHAHAASTAAPGPLHAPHRRFDFATPPGGLHQRTPILIRYRNYYS